ncbi:MAG TPA: bifunctional (p)ppGpp synthetase/guanosine-3',5'-bis(diphosphate) 3'-pyrophosphohydrolase [Armatimonadota bacterium]
MLSIGIPKLEGTQEERFERVLARVARSIPQFNRELLVRVYEFAVLIHGGQTRKSGDPYIIHPLEVAYILSELEMDEASVAAGLLHDTIEDGLLERPNGDITPVTHADLSQRFGPEIASLVEGVTKLGALHFHSKEARQAENLRKMLLATARDIRVILIKLADRLHNMRTLKYLSEADQLRIADETLRIFAPIAHRLGIWKIKWELEDQSLRYLDAEAYRQIQNRVNRTRSEREEVVSTAIQQLTDRMAQLGIEADVVGRPKHFYSIYNKMKSQDIDFNQILDLEAIRVLVNNVQACYAVLGEVHSLWLPLPNMFTDYIAKPKPNLYQSLHTKVIGPHGQPLEVQIRTWDMHRTAEVGIAAHWHYKEGGSRDVDFESKLAWLRGLLDSQNEAKSEADWIESIKVDLFKDQVFVFTPAGDIIDLPAGSTPIDFAYRIHTDIGSRCSGAKVNGRLVPLSYHFANGDVVEIIVRANQVPSLDWLTYVASAHARGKIKAFFRKRDREENIQHGHAALDEECRRLGLPAVEVLRQEKLLAVANKMNLMTVEELYALIGYGEITAEGVIHRIREDIPKRSLDELRASGQSSLEQGQLPIQISSSGIDGIFFRLSRCCKPIPGDVIVGYVTRGKGVTIHRMDCPNLQKLRSNPEETERLMTLEWQDTGEGLYDAEIEIVVLDRLGLLADIGAILSETKTNIRSAKMTSEPKKHTGHIIITVDTTGTQHLQSIIQRINVLSDIIQIHRRGTGA